MIHFFESLRESVCIYALLLYSSVLTESLFVVPSPVGDGTQPVFPSTSSLTDSNDVWRCQYCTLDNSVHETMCNACGLPRN